MALRKEYYSDYPGIQKIYGFSCERDGDAFDCEGNNYTYE